MKRSCDLILNPTNDKGTFLDKNQITNVPRNSIYVYICGKVRPELAIIFSDALGMGKYYRAVRKIWHFF
jgi:hypothetical protein